MRTSMSLLSSSNEAIRSASVNEVSMLGASTTTKVNSPKKIHRKPVDLIYLMVPRKGLEPPRCYSLVPETSASTNSATWAHKLHKCNMF